MATPHILYQRLHISFASLVMAGVFGCGSTAGPNPETQQPVAVAPSASATPSSSTFPPLAPDLQVTDWTGVEQLVADQTGKVVVVNLWTTTCGTCRAHFPEIVELSHQWPDQVAVIGANCDYDGIADKPPTFYQPQIEKFLQQQVATFPHAVLNRSLIQVLKELDLHSTPAVFVYDRQGKLVKRFDNDHAVKTEDEFTIGQVRELVQKLLTEPAAS